MRSKSIARAFVIALSAGLSFGTVSSSYAEEAVPAVASSPAFLNELFSKQWVKLASDNSVSGSLVKLTESDKVAVAGLPVVLVHDGVVAYRAVADDAGNFKFTDVEAGSYSLVTRTNESIAAFSLQVLDSNSSHLPSNVEVRVVRPSGSKVQEILRSQTLPSYPIRNDGGQQIEKDPLGESRAFGKSHLIQVDASGRFNGQLGAVAGSSDMSDMQIFVLQDGVEVAKVRSDKLGRFSFQGLQPGVYGFVAAGKSGFAATSFQLVNGSSASIAKDGSRLVGLFHDACHRMNVEVVQCCEVVACEQPVQVVEQPIVESCNEVVVDNCGCAPSGGVAGGWGGYGGGFGGGFGGGGGGGGIGGGGLAGIAGIAGLATVAGIAASRNNRNANAVTSPVVP